MLSATIAKKPQNKKLVFPLYHRTGESAGDFLKWSYLRARSHLLALFDLYALRFGSLFGLLLKILHPDLGNTF